MISVCVTHKVTQGVSLLLINCTIIFTPGKIVTMRKKSVRMNASNNFQAYIYISIIFHVVITQSK
jgi:hypothetical protein